MSLKSLGIFSILCPQDPTPKAREAREEAIQEEPAALQLHKLQSVAWPSQKMGNKMSKNIPFNFRVCLKKVGKK